VSLKLQVSGLLLLLFHKVASIMKGSTDLIELRRRLGRFWQQLEANAGRFANVGRSEPAAARVTAAVAADASQARSLFFENLERAQARANLSAAEADALAREAVKAVRSDFLR
jgi:hypothetical protein